MLADAVVILPYIALGVVVLGWFVSNHQANAREDRKEARSLVDGAKKLVSQVAEDSLAYLCHGEANLAVRITSTLETLEVELQRVPSFTIPASRLMAALVAFQDATTGGDFETAHPVKRTLQSAEVAAVLRTRNALHAELERQYKEEYSL